MNCVGPLFPRAEHFHQTNLNSIKNVKIECDEDYLRIMGESISIFFRTPDSTVYQIECPRENVERSKSMFKDKIQEEENKKNNSLYFYLPDRIKIIDNEFFDFLSQYLNFGRINLPAITPETIEQVVENYKSYIEVSSYLQCEELALLFLENLATYLEKFSHEIDFNLQVNLLSYALKNSHTDLVGFMFSFMIGNYWKALQGSNNKVHKHVIKQLMEKCFALDKDLREDTTMKVYGMKVADISFGWKVDIGEGIFGKHYEFPGIHEKIMKILPKVNKFIFKDEYFCAVEENGRYYLQPDENKEKYLKDA